MVSEMLGALFNSSRKTKLGIAISYDCIAIALSLAAAIQLRLGSLESDIRSIDLLVLFLTPVFAVAVFSIFGVYKTVVRYSSHKPFITIMCGLGAAAVVLIGSSFFFYTFIPRSVPIIFVFIALFFVTLPRLLIRSLIPVFAFKRGAPIIIYGAGISGIELARTMQSNDLFLPIAFIDDNPALSGSSINGIPICPSIKLESLIVKRRVERVLLVVDDISKKEKLRIIRSLEKYKIKVSAIPALSEIVSDSFDIEKIRDVAIEDLLGREPVKPDPKLIQANILKQNVLVTGAGGSIGSQLCKQILLNKPSLLVMFDASEYNLYKIYEELQKLVAENISLKEVKLVPLLGNIINKNLIEITLSSFSISTIYHAAAYKHVPIVEHNVIEGIKNNLFGTLNCAEAAITNNVKTFVLISTDKAVRPTNIMGASKRMSELVLQALARENNSTNFSMVRFGNVLDSSGSVVPKFRKQINAGGPITVTHPDITRYFMTTMEAAELVIQAGALAKGGDVFVLEMGEPIKIAELAREMIQLSGLNLKSEENPDGEIAIKFIGLRPGEKLFEELLVGEECQPTSHSRIKRANEYHLSWSELFVLLEKLKSQCELYDLESIQATLMSCPIAYGPTHQLVDKLLTQRTEKNSNLKLISG